MTAIQFITEPLSPYALAKELSTAASKEIRPQMVYGATHVNEDGEAKLRTSRNSTGKQVVSVKDGNAYIQAYLDRQKARETKAAETAEEVVTETN